RRHTRFSRDWSSDVCSSDLIRWRPAGRSPSKCTSRPAGCWRAGRPRRPPTTGASTGSGARPPDARGPGGVMTMESILGYMERYDYENLFICQDRSVGLRAVIAIHDTTLGPATGGTRMWTYPSEMDAIEDALRLARGMTYKYAAAGVNLGGGKCVIIGDPRREKSEMLF